MPVFGKEAFIVEIGFGDVIKVAFLHASSIITVKLAVMLAESAEAVIVYA